MATTKYLDPDFRTKGIGPHCLLCARSLKSEGGAKEVRYYPDSMEAVDISEWDKMLAHDGDYLLDGKTVYSDKIGGTCAKRFGGRWSK